MVFAVSTLRSPGLLLDRVAALLHRQDVGAVHCGARRTSPCTSASTRQHGARPARCSSVDATWRQSAGSGPVKA